jgi:cytochrome c oxidase subunit IV
MSQVHEREAEELHSHPQPRDYVNIAIILAVVTALEVAIYYIDAIRVVLVPFLLAFSFIKFMLVVLWFMHLRFDSVIFRRFFMVGVLLAITVFGVVLAYFFTHGGPAPGAS